MENLESKLPLLFANGECKSLQTMNLGQLQRFLLFILKCEQCIPIIPNSLRVFQPPKWWPEDIDYDDELLRKTKQKGLWSRNIRRIIGNCYEHYQSEFLLEFSQRLEVISARDGSIIIKDNGNGTRSMISAANQKLLVIFRSENQDYDKEYHEYFES